MSAANQTNYFAHTLLRAHNWQHRQEFDQVCDWWRGGGRGVCALVGMGGAGKTAIAERFLRVLPGGLPADPDVAKDASLPEPHSTFVFSFYDAPNPEAFFEALQMWLEHSPRVDTVLSIAQMLFLLQQTPGLIVMDGLEKVQDDGSRGTFGRLSSPKLREFLDHLAAGYARDLAVLVTSRFPLADLRDKRETFFRTVPVDEIDVAAGVQLLRDRGVNGTDMQLAPIVEHCGRHALTIDFAGGYISEYRDCDPATPLDLGTAEELQQLVQDEIDEQRREVAKQGHRFARIAGYYRKAMLKADEAALALLERICLFRLGVDCKTLAAIFTGPAAEKVSGKALAELNTEQLQKELDWLVHMRIVEESEAHSLITEDSQLTTLYTIHPAVRDGFLRGISRDAALASHDAVRESLEGLLGNAPGENPSDTATLDLLEEIVHHTLQSGHVQEAWDIFGNKMGGYQNLGWRLGAYERGERICLAFAGRHSPESLFPPTHSPAKAPLNKRSIVDSPPYIELTEASQVRLINAWGLYLLHLGRLSSAAHCYEAANKPDYKEENWRSASVGNQNLCAVWLLVGRLSGTVDASALSTAKEAHRLGEFDRDADNLCNSLAYCGHCHALLGNVSDALAEFRAALRSQHEHDKHAENRPLYSSRGFWHTELLARLDRREESMRLTEENQKVLVNVFGNDHQDIPKCNLVLAQISAVHGSRSTAMDLWEAATAWASRRDATEVLCWSLLVRGRIELAVPTNGSSPDFVAAQTAITRGLKISRSCGFGLYHIDLLLEQARLNLLRGIPDAALADINLALDTGIAPNESTGQPELLAANDAACGYAWPLPLGLQLRAEAQLLQAAQHLGTRVYDSKRLIDQIDGALDALHLVDTELDHAVKAKDSHDYEHVTIDSMVKGRTEAAIAAVRTLAQLDIDGSLAASLRRLEVFLQRSLNGKNVESRHPKFHDLVVNVASSIEALYEDWSTRQHSSIQDVITSARENLQTALELWQPLHDPEPERPDQNFQHDGKSYNYRAAETWKILQDLSGGVLTRYPLQIQPLESVAPIRDGETEVPVAPPAAGQSKLVQEEKRESYSQDEETLRAWCRRTRRELRDSIEEYEQSLWDGAEAIDLGAHPVNAAITDAANSLADLGNFDLAKELTSRVAGPLALEATLALLMKVEDWCTRSLTGSRESQPSRFIIRMDMDRDEFKLIAQQAFLRELANVLGTSPNKISIEELLDGSIVAVLRFSDEVAIARFMNMRLTGHELLGEFCRTWKISNIEFQADEEIEFDTFLSHNSKDKPAVRQLADALVARGLKPWLDERELVPGRPWQDALEQIIQTTKTALLMFGPAGLGPWEEPEMRACLSEFVKRRLPVVPVLLPGAPNEPELPVFLQAFTWVDLRGGLTEEGLDRLHWGISGQKPDSLAAPTGAPPHPPVTTESESWPLAIWREKLEYLQQQNAIVADAGQKFAIKKLIEEAERKIRELSRTV